MELDARKKSPKNNITGQDSEINQTAYENGVGSKLNPVQEIWIDVLMDWRRSLECYSMDIREWIQSFCKDHLLAQHLHKTEE